MKLSFANNASPKALFWGFVCLLPAAIFMSIAIIARGLGLPFLGGTALSGAGQTFFILSLLILPLVALVVNLVALTRHLMINSNQAVRGSFTTRYFWTVALVGVSVLWFVFLLGHDTIGCGLQYVTHLDWAAFSRCNTAH